MTSSFQTSGFDTLNRNLARLEEGLSDQVLLEALMDGGEVVAAEARRLVPVDTGLLRDSIAVVPDRDARIYGRVNAGGVSVYIGPAGSTEDGDVYYARFIEFGTIHMVAQPFMRPAIASKRDEAGRRIVARLQVTAGQALR